MSRSPPRKSATDGSPDLRRTLHPATVRYDSELSHPDSLAPPDMDEIMQRRHPWQRYFQLDFPRHVQLPLTSAAIAISALQANGVYCWPTYGPVVAKTFELDSTEAQTIVVAGILGVYCCAAPLGALTDRLGPRGGSLVSALLSAIGYLGFALILSTKSPATPYLYLYLTVAFAFVGAATVGSYFAALTCASLSFPSHPTIALSVPLACMSCSSLFLASFSNIPYFQTSNNEVNPTRFLIFLGIFCPAVNLVAALFMRVVPQKPPITLEDTNSEHLHSPIGHLLHLDEHTPLMIGGPEAGREEAEAEERGKDIKWTAVGLVKDWEGFWAFGLILALCIGSGEAILASIGSILTSLIPPTSALHSLTSAGAPGDALKLRNKHVTILSISGTIARLATGFMADYFAPPLVAVALPPSENPDAPTHKFVRKQKVRLWRASFAAISAALLAGVFACEAGFLSSERGLWVLSAGVGAMYGSLYTLTPAIVAAHYGPANFGLAWGMVSYFAAVGSAGFNYLYALLSVAAVERSDPLPTTIMGTMGKMRDEPVLCYGPECFRLFFWVCVPSCLLAAGGFIFISRRWRV